MDIFRELVKQRKLTHPLSLTMGIFDGVHLGHQEVLKRTCSLGKTSCVITFDNHPIEFFAKKKIELLVSLEKRLELFEKAGIDIVYLLHFDDKIGNARAFDFLQTIKNAYPFDYLILGYDGVFGKNREGTPDLIQSFQKQLNFKVEYLPPLLDQNLPISSTRIRKLLLEGKHDEALRLLGRPCF